MSSEFKGGERRILVVAPHADDEVLGCGGFISKYSRKSEINIL